MRTAQQRDSLRRALTLLWRCRRMLISDFSMGALNFFLWRHRKPYDYFKCSSEEEEEKVEEAAEIFLGMKLLGIILRKRKLKMICIGVLVCALSIFFSSSVTTLMFYENDGRKREREREIEILWKSTPIDLLFFIRTLQRDTFKRRNNCSFEISDVNV